MKAIKFSEKELEFLRLQYQDELAQAKDYVDQIIDILNKLGVPSKAIKEEAKEKEPKQYKKRGSKAKAKKVVAQKEPKKRGRKPQVSVVENAPVPTPKPEKKVS